MSCVVPNCNNSMGMPFPLHAETKQKWIDSLCLNFEPTEKNFVCLDHFRPSDIIESDLDEIEFDPENVKSMVVLRKGAIPYLEDEDFTEILQRPESKACRVCNSKNNLARNIFETLEGGTTITSMIMLCAYPIIIKKSDNLPKYICTNCLKQLQKCFKFRLRCLRTNKFYTQASNKPQEEYPSPPPPKKPCLEPLPEIITIIAQAKAEPTEPQEADDIAKILALPKGTRITVTPRQPPESEVGTFNSTRVKGPRGSDFLSSEGYFYAIRLSKGNCNYVKCIDPTCKSIGIEIDDVLSLMIEHNHEKPDPQSRTKHMFFQVMKKKLQLDKNLNIRSIFEQFAAQEPDIRRLVPLRNVINEICKYQNTGKPTNIGNFEEFYDRIEDEDFEELHFTTNNKQFYQERFQTDDGSYAIVFCNVENVEKYSTSNLMYVDTSFNVSSESYYLVTVLVWISDSYFPILYAVINKKSQEIFTLIFKHLHETLAPNLKPYEIVTDYEASIYYALGEIYLDSHIGGSIFYYTQNIYKKICSLNLSKELESNSNFRNIYHMLLMLPLLPVNTIEDALSSIHSQAKDVGLGEVSEELFEHVYEEWIRNVTPELFCVHHLENRINENVIAPFKKLRDYLLLMKDKTKDELKLIPLVEKLLELEGFLREAYDKGDKKYFARDLSSLQKKNVVRAWSHIESHPKININTFFQKVLGYIKCMENQLWIWGFYGYKGPADDVLISARNLENPEDVNEEILEDTELKSDMVENTLVMEAVIDNDGGVVIQNDDFVQDPLIPLTYIHYGT